MNNVHECLGRVGGIAVFDVVATIGVCLYISRVYHTDPYKTMAFGFVAGEVVHVVLGVQTPVTRSLSK